MERKSWLTDHLEGFVRPTLGSLDGLSNHPPYFSKQEMTVLKNMWRAVKKMSEGKVILLAGRDVFLFEVLARREGYPTIFKPDISRLSVDYVKEDYKGYFLFDTGFAGSIPRQLKSSNFILGSADQHVNSRIPIIERNIQVFPRMTGARSLILKLEATPKYWRRAYVRDEKICQDQSELAEFKRAAILTIQIYKDSSPKFAQMLVEQPRTLIEHLKSGTLGVHHAKSL